MDTDQALKLKSYATLRELSRIMMTDQDKPAPEISYSNGSHRIQGASQRLLDACYLFDGRRHGDSEKLNHIVARAILAFIVDGVDSSEE
jgi:hypothetical protein